MPGAGMHSRLTWEDEEKKKKAEQDKQTKRDLNEEIEQEADAMDTDREAK